jgi:hypothetical protein
MYREKVGGVIMKITLIFVTMFVYATANAQEKGKLLLYDPIEIPAATTSINSGKNTAPKPKPADINIFERTVKSAIQTLENSMRKTCAREMETSISVTAEGNWAIVGVSITGAMKLSILNPEMSKNCAEIRDKS